MNFIKRLFGKSEPKEPTIFNIKTELILFDAEITFTDNTPPLKIYDALHYKYVSDYKAHNSQIYGPLNQNGGEYFYIGVYENDDFVVEVLEADGDFNMDADVYRRLNETRTYRTIRIKNEIVKFIDGFNFREINYGSILKIYNE